MGGGQSALSPHSAKAANSVFTTGEELRVAQFFFSPLSVRFHQTRG
jgi:hypothetical protein